MMMSSNDGRIATDRMAAILYESYLGMLMPNDVWWNWLLYHDSQSDRTDFGSLPWFAQNCSRRLSSPEQVTYALLGLNLDLAASIDRVTGITKRTKISRTCICPCMLFQLLC